MTTSPTRVVLTLATVGLTAVLTSCGADDPTTDDTSKDPSSMTTSVAEPLAITDHVLDGDSLPGFEPEGRPRAEDLHAFAEAHEKTPAELRESGFLSGSSLFFTGKGDDFAISVAVAYADRAAADAEANRLFASNTEGGDPSTEVIPLEVPGVPGVLAASLVGSQGEKEYTGVEVVFVDGAVLHEVFAVGESRRFDLDAVVASVRDLYDEVAGRPLQ
ncbi:hypothetical protein D0Z08_25760 [Nocardioides immobilis]|uniref:DUF3558 domain-containing protein n=1 Tax=Nocardioides immobilis TaxID=2049295 RepID=A0A417XUL0_9ACTN|nr:hypothetical protein [Nocardioides immobilis]RHW24132.1 hypothetical protein D0Z08_25760 [Nocardioides immobilis]